MAFLITFIFFFHYFSHILYFCLAFFWMFKKNVVPLRVKNVIEATFLMKLSITAVILLIDILFFSTYLVCVLKTFGIPINLSITYYHYERRHKGMGLLFPTLLLFLCSTALPIWISTTHDVSFAGTYLLSCPIITLICLLLVALSARYKRRPKLIYFHYSCAILAAICAVAWIFLFAYKVVYVGLGILFVLLLIGLRTNTLKRCTLFWLELAAFYAILFTLLIIHLIPIQI